MKIKKKIAKTLYDSYCLKDFDVTKGCKYCVKGQKLVLFITGLCSRACFYCSLSEKRKNQDTVWANERLCKKPEDVIAEAKESNAKGAGITGGDPLIKLARTIKYAKMLKKTFPKFHIHIYLPTDKVNLDNLENLSKYIDEIRFHPRFLKNSKKEIEKIKLAGFFWKRQQIGIEMPVLPDKTKEIIKFIKEAEPFIGFVNLNELEISDTNFNYTTKKYKINTDTYTIQGSLEAGLKILKKLKTKLKIHLCTARTKNLWQYKNRLKLHKILPFGYRTQEGSVRYFVVYFKDLNKKQKIFLKKFKKQIYFDKKKKRFIVSEKIVPKLLKVKFKIARVEETPTYDATMLELEYL